MGGTSPDPAPRKRFPGNIFPGADKKFKLFLVDIILAVTQSNQTTGQPSWQSLNQTSQLDSHPGSHSIKPVNLTAILAVTQSNQSTGQPSWQPLNQTRQLDSHPGSHSIKPGNWTAILAATQSNQASGQPSWQSLIKPASESWICLLYTSPSPRDLSTSRMPSSA